MSDRYRANKSLFNPKLSFSKAFLRASKRAKAFLEPASLFFIGKAAKNVPNFFVFVR